MSTVQENFDYKRTVKVNLASEKIRHHESEVICRKPFARSLCPPTRNSRASPLVSAQMRMGEINFFPATKNSQELKGLFVMLLLDTVKEKNICMLASLSRNHCLVSHATYFLPTKRNVLRDKSKQRLSLLCSNVSVVIVSHTGV